MERGQTQPNTVAQLVQAAKARIENLTADQVADEIARGAAVLVDLREPAERSLSGAIAGAIHVPRGMLEFRADAATPYYDPALAPSTRTILYCASGGRSALGVRALQELGYANVAHLDGGFHGWVAAGKPVAPVTEA